jgi:hypothetical protein
MLPNIGDGQSLRNSDRASIILEKMSLKHSDIKSVVDRASNPRSLRPSEKASSHAAVHTLDQKSCIQEPSNKVPSDGRGSQKAKAQGDGASGHHSSSTRAPHTNRDPSVKGEVTSDKVLQSARSKQSFVAVSEGTPTDLLIQKGWIVGPSRSGQKPPVNPTPAGSTAGQAREAQAPSRGPGSIKKSAAGAIDVGKASQAARDGNHGKEPANSSKHEAILRASNAGSARQPSRHEDATGTGPDAAREASNHVSKASTASASAAPHGGVSAATTKPNTSGAAKQAYSAVKPWLPLGTAHSALRIPKSADFDPNIPAKGPPSAAENTGGNSAAVPKGTHAHGARADGAAQKDSARGRKEEDAAAAPRGNQKIIHPKENLTRAARKWQRWFQLLVC